MTSSAVGHAHIDHDEEHPPDVIWSHKMPIGMMGILFFIGSEIALFGSFFMAYFFIRVAQSADYYSWAALMGEAVPLKVATMNSIILFSSSVTVHWAEIALRRGTRGWQAIWIFATFLLGSTFLSIQIMEYASLVTDEKIGPSSNAYSSVFFSLTGLHGSHVLVGAILLLTLFVRTRRGHYGPDDTQHIGFKSMSIYWHFVDAVWIFVFGLIYIPGNWDRWNDTEILAGLTGPVFMAIGVVILFFLALGLPKLLNREAPKHA
jgi:cytochrome c oxidase subunit 3